MMTTLTNGTIGASNKEAAPKAASKSAGRKSPKLALVEFRQNSPLSLECYKNRLLTQRGVHAPIMNGTRVAIKLTNPGAFFDLEEMLKDCHLQDNAKRCPGRSGTIRHTMIGDNAELTLETSFPDDLWLLVHKHRLSDLDPEPARTA